MRPSQTILVLEDLRTQFSGHLYRNGVRLEPEDTQTVIDVYLQWLCVMTDLGYLHPDTLVRDAQRLFTDMVKADVLILNNAFADLLQCLRTQQDKGFKALCRKISSHLYHLIRSDFERILSNDVYAADRLNQLFSYTSRLTLRKIDLTQQCLDDYMEVERNMSTYLPNNLLSELNSIIKFWMKSFDPTLIKFNHGPGGVAGHGRESYQVKYKDLTYDRHLVSVFGEPYWSNGPIRSNLDRISQTIFVPKSYKTFRTISMEPSTLQYLQQGVWREIDRVVGSWPWLRNRIGFREGDDHRNQRLARIGSLQRNYATIDLSAASDSVSYALVKKIFAGTKLLKFLVATRSRRTLLPDGRLVKLKKFAPMGSSLCFPVETLIFAAICHYVTREHYVFGDYSVYGDDIIVPTQCVDDTMLILETLGFKVNTSKSYYRDTCWFRESCGGEYVDGFDITPMRVSREYYHTFDDGIEMLALIDLANRAYGKGFRLLRQFFLNKLRSVPLGFKSYWNRKQKKKVLLLDEDGNKIPYFAVPLYSPTSLHADSYSNYHTKIRWNKDLQRLECRAHQPVVKYDDDELVDEDIRYRHWLESTANRISIGDGFVSEIRHPIVSMKSCWRAKPYEPFDQQLIDFYVQ